MAAYVLSFITICFTYRLVYQKVCNLFTFLTLWILYLSLYKVGQTFLYFQWDIMLLESGFITIIVAPIIYTKNRSTTPKDQICFWLVKWLLFRLMFASGVVKLTSKCSQWWGLSGIHFYCIPHSNYQGSPINYVCISLSSATSFRVTVHSDTICMVPLPVAYLVSQAVNSGNLRHWNYTTIFVFHAFSQTASYFVLWPGQTKILCAKMSKELKY